MTMMKRLHWWKALRTSRGRLDGMNWMKNIDITWDMEELHCWRSGF